jgi:hypothetical protein
MYNLPQQQQQQQSFSSVGYSRLAQLLNCPSNFGSQLIQERFQISRHHLQQQAAAVAAAAVVPNLSVSCQLRCGICLPIPHVPKQHGYPLVHTAEPLGHLFCCLDALRLRHCVALQRTLRLAMMTVTAAGATADANLDFE